MIAQRGPCHWCGHEHLVMASASRKDEQRWFCHADDHSCYNDRRGKYFDDEPAISWRDSLHIPKELDDSQLWEDTEAIYLKRMLARYGEKEFNNTPIPASFARGLRKVHDDES